MNVVPIIKLATVSTKLLATFAYKTVRVAYGLRQAKKEAHTPPITPLKTFKQDKRWQQAFEALGFPIWHVTEIVTNHVDEQSGTRTGVFRFSKDWVDDYVFIEYRADGGGAGFHHPSLDKVLGHAKRYAQNVKG